MITKTRIPSFHLFLDRDFIVTIPMNASVMVIGRRSGCHIRINHESVSREHCEISLRENGDVTIRDLNSTNTTRVNGKTISLRLLDLGDVIDVGRCSLIFQEVAPNLLQAYGAVFLKVLRKSPAHTQLSEPRGRFQVVNDDLVTEFNVLAYEQRFTSERTEYVRKIPRLKLIAQREDNEITQMSSNPIEWTSPKQGRTFKPTVFGRHWIIFLLLLGLIVGAWVLSTLVRLE